MLFFVHFSIVFVSLQTCLKINWRRCPIFLRLSKMCCFHLLQVHRQTHFPEQPRLYCCAKCDYSSNYRANLHKHTQNIHVERARVLPCTICDKLFSTDDNLRRHAKLHAQVCSYRCNRCEKTFKSQAALRCHTASHDVVRPYRCNIGDCQREFRIAKFLKSHQEEFHRLIPKKYHCTVSGCGFSFFKISHLKRHEISHTGDCFFQVLGVSFMWYIACFMCLVNYC